MLRTRTVSPILLCFVVLLPNLRAAATNVLNDPGFFPLAVWVQSPKNAESYKALGINTYVGLWHGPTAEHIATLKKAGMKIICAQNEVGLRHRDDPAIIAWMHGDEPDNAQSLGEGKGYGPPILPQVIVDKYARLKAADPTRPVLLNMGQGVAWDNYIGRGVRRNHPEDYPEYLKGCDIASFDIYPAVHENKEVAGKLEYVARGVERLVEWTEGKKPVWNCLESTRISNEKTKPTPAQVRTEAWMALIHGSRGLIYFVHQFKPVFREAALLDDAEMVSAVTALNAQITELAPVLNSPTIENILDVRSSSGAVPVATMVKKFNDDLYVFAVAMRNEDVKTEFKLPSADAEIRVLGEDRTLSLKDGMWEDRFPGYGVHIYVIPGGANSK